MKNSPAIKNFSCLLSLFNSHVRSISLFPHSFPPMSSHSSFFPPLSNSLSLHGLREAMHLAQMKEKLGIEVIFVDSGTVWGVNPLLRIWGYNNAEELNRLKSKRPRLLKEKYEEIWTARLKPASQFQYFNCCFLLGVFFAFSFSYSTVRIFLTSKLSIYLWLTDQEIMTDWLKIVEL